MTERQQLLAAIRDYPFEDTPRLMLADWLDENGTTDQDAARSEWIRLTCTKSRSKWINATHPALRTRIPGECTWLKANIARLWPTLAARLPDRFGVVKLLTGKIELAVSVPMRGNSNKTVGSRIVIYAERGFTRWVSVGFGRASVVAPWVAEDEPDAPIETSVPDRTISPHGGLVDPFRREPQSDIRIVSRRPFLVAGLDEVFGLLCDPPMTGNVMIGNLQSHVIVHKSDIHEMIDRALTQWARSQVAKPSLLTVTA